MAFMTWRKSRSEGKKRGQRRDSAGKMQELTAEVLSHVSLGSGADGVPQGAAAHGVAPAVGPTNVTFLRAGKGNTKENAEFPSNIE